MPLNFHKMHANGDDFVIVDSRNSASPVTSAIAQRMGDRNRGVGFNLDCASGSVVPGSRWVQVLARAARWSTGFVVVCWTASSRLNVMAGA